MPRRFRSIGPSQIAASLTGLALVVAVTFSSSAQNTQTVVISEKGISGIEGPAVDADGNLYFVSRKGKADGKILQLKPGAKKSEVYTPLEKGSLGNGIRFDKDGRMYVADFNGNSVLVFEKGKKKSSPYFSTKQAKKGAPAFKQPNDIAMGNDGTVYASDPMFGAGTGRIWRITRDASDKGQGEIMTSEPRSKMGVTNGLDLSPDGKTLYVSESSTREVWAYRIDGVKLVPLGSKALKTFDGPRNSELDGLRTDASGRIFVTRPRNQLEDGEPPCAGPDDPRCIGTIAILKPNGELEREVRTVGRKPSNLTFGGPDGKTVFVTQVDGGFIETFTVDTPGREPCPAQKSATVCAPP